MKVPEYYWWGYLHSNGTVQVKRWFGDHKDYTDDCEDNPFVLTVVEPFMAHSRGEAERIIMDKLNETNLRKDQQLLG